MNACEKYRVSPIDNPNVYDRTDAELEAWLLFVIFVSNKPAARAMMMLDEFLRPTVERESVTFCLSPFAFIRHLLAALDGDGSLYDRLVAARTGQYDRIGTALSQIVEKFRTGADLRDVSVLDLEAQYENDARVGGIYGIGPKTARFFVSSTQRNARYAILDTHVLKMLRANGHTTLKSTPRGRLYLALEEVVLALADAAGMTPAEYDFKVWSEYANAEKSGASF